MWALREAQATLQLYVSPERNSENKHLLDHESACSNGQWSTADPENHQPPTEYSRSIFSPDKSATHAVVLSLRNIYVRDVHHGPTGVERDCVSSSTSSMVSSSRLILIHLYPDS